MTTLTADPITPQRSPNKPTSVKSSFILKESTNANSSICCCGNKFSHSLNVLREIPTSNFQETNTTTVIDPLNNDDDNAFNDNAQEDMEMFSTFLQEWDAFCAEFKNSITYALAKSSAASLFPSLIDNDDADNNQKVHERNADKTPTNSSDGFQ